MAKVVKGISLRSEIYEAILVKASQDNRNFSNFVECILEQYIADNPVEKPVDAPTPKLKLGGRK